MRASPVVGTVMRDRILSSVVLPAPLWPTTPTARPRSTSNVASRSAQISSLLRLSGVRPRSPRTYRLPSPCASMARSDDIGEGALGAREVEGTADDEDERRSDRDAQVQRVDMPAAEERPAVALDDAGHRIDVVEQPVLRGDG